MLKQRETVTGGGSFFLTCKDLGENFPWTIPHLQFIFQVKVSLCTPMPLFQLGSVHSGLVSWDDCGKMWARKSPYPHQNTAFLLSLKENYWASLLPYTISRLMSTLALHQDVIFSQQTAPKGLNTSWKLDLFNTILLPVCFTYMLYSY